MHLIGVVSSYKQSGTDSAYLSVGEGDDTLGCAASEVRRGALMVRVVGGPAVPAAPVIGAVAGFVSRVLAVTPETVDVGWKCLLAFPNRAARWGPWIFHHSPFETVFSFTIFWIAIGRFLCGMNARDDAAGRGSGASAKEMGNQMRPDCSVCQVVFHLVLLLLSFELLSP